MFYNLVQVLIFGLENSNLKKNVIVSNGFILFFKSYDWLQNGPHHLYLGYNDTNLQKVIHLKD